MSNSNSPKLNQRKRGRNVIAIDESLALQDEDLEPLSKRFTTLGLGLDLDSLGLQTDRNLISNKEKDNNQQCQLHELVSVSISAGPGRELELEVPNSEPEPTVRTMTDTFSKMLHGPPDNDTLGGLNPMRMTNTHGCLEASIGGEELQASVASNSQAQIVIPRPDSIEAVEDNNLNHSADYCQHYNPALTKVDNPIYYEPNRTLHQLYCDRMKRTGTGMSRL